MRFHELDELATYRLDRQLSFAELEKAMTEAGFPVPLRTLHNLIAREGKIRTPYETTLHQIRRFLAHERDAGRLSPANATDTPTQEHAR